MPNYFATVRALLASIDPAAPAAALILTVFFAVYATRRWLPRVWLWLEKALPFVDSLDYRPVATILSKFMQSLPGALLGVVVASLSSGTSVKSAVFGVLAGFAASLTHEIMANYKGQVSAPKPLTNPMGPMGGMFVLCLCLSLTGCAWLRDSFAPAAKHCEPSPPAIVSQVEQILLSGGEYQKTLEQLAVQDGESIITCAVATAIELLANNVGAEDGSSDAAARGKAYLAKHPAQ